MVAQWNGTLFLGLYCLHVVLLRPVVATNDTSVGNKEASSIGESCTASDVCEASERSTITSGPECGVWLALSTIPGAGLGIFAGKKFRRDETLMVGGDQTIPIVDIVSHQGETIPFLWDDYTWVSRRGNCETPSDDAISLFLRAWTLSFVGDLECRTTGDGRLGME